VGGRGEFLSAAVNMGLLPPRDKQASPSMTFDFFWEIDGACGNARSASYFFTVAHEHV
jgi:hypothetical protein